jgi:hypothetical protein
MSQKEKDDRREEIKKQLEQFLANGGEIKLIPEGTRTEDPFINICKYAIMSDY